MSKKLAPGLTRFNDCLILKMTLWPPTFSRYEEDQKSFLAYKCGLFIDAYLKMAREYSGQKSDLRATENPELENLFQGKEFQPDQEVFPYSRVGAVDQWMSGVDLSLFPFLNRSVCCNYRVPVPVFHIGCGRYG